MNKVLIIGCGNIGALYDFNNDKVQTHAKAFFLSGNADIYLYDTDRTLLESVAERYQAGMITDIDAADFSQYDYISICSPTSTHAFFLEKAFRENARIVICEKPVTGDETTLSRLVQLYRQSQTKVFVNYFRRFQPAFAALKEYIGGIAKEESLTNVSVRTQRGFINNSSHAFDLIQFLTGQTINLTGITASNIVFDHFDTDPTLSLQASWNNASFNLAGLANVKFSFFEIDLFFETYRISITNAGADIAIYKTKPGGSTFLNPLQLLENSAGWRNAIDNYMLYVVGHVQKITKSQNAADNFIESAELNRTMLQILLSQAAQ